MVWKADVKQASASDPKTQDPAGSTRHFLLPGRAGGLCGAAALPEHTGVMHHEPEPLHTPEKLYHGGQ